MAENEIHVGDVGTLFIVTVMENDAILDISSAITKQIIFKSPSGTRKVKDAEFVNGGIDGKLSYETEANDLNKAEGWSIQVYLEFTSGAWHTDIATFHVYENL